MLIAASTATSNGQGTICSGTARRRRHVAASAPILGMVVRTAATAGGVPSVTSGTQKWAGTAPALNARPASTATRPTAAGPAAPVTSPSGKRVVARSSR